MKKIDSTFETKNEEKWITNLKNLEEKKLENDCLSSTKMILLMKPPGHGDGESGSEDAFEG